MLRRIILFAFAITTLASCDKNSDTTIEYIKNSIVENYSNSATFSTLAFIAKADSLFQTAAMFEASSESMRIQAQNQTKGLNDLDVYLELDSSKAPVDNIFERQGRKVTMQEFITKAEKILEQKAANYEKLLKNPDAKFSKAISKTLTQEKVTNGKIANYLALAKSNIESQGDDLLLSEKWFVCPTCGDMYESEDLAQNCDICQTPASEFNIFQAGSSAF